MDPFHRQIVQDDGPLYMKRIPIRALKIETDEHISRARAKANNPENAEVGNYLVTGHRGCNYIVLGDIFEEMYVLHGSNNG
jgi:hypothetical protein